MKLGLRELTFFLVLVGLLAGAAWFVFIPGWRGTEQDRQETREMQSRLGQLNRLGQTSENLNSELKELSKALEFFESKLPNDQQIHSVLREVTQITDKHGLTTRAVRTLKQVDSSDYVSQPIEMDMTGDFAAFYKFLLDLERMPRITRINQMELTKDKAGEGVVQAKMVVSVYFEPSSRRDPSGLGGAQASRMSSRAGGGR